MKKNPLVSIIMNCHNGELFLEQSLKSIFLQSYKNWELIFWDNKSQDQSKKILIKFKDKRIKYYYSKKFNSLYNSRNLAIKKAKGKYITFLDTDDFWHKEKLNNQINFLINNNFKVCCTNFYILNQKNNKKIKFIKKNKKKLTTQNLLKRYEVGILTVMIEKSLFTKNLFNKKYNIIGDFDFFISLSLNHDIGFLNKILATYRLHEVNLSNKRIDLHIKELNSWIKSNRIILENKRLNINAQKFNLIKLKIKKNLKLLKFFS